MSYCIRYVLMLLIVLAGFETHALGDAQEETIETARLLAILLDSGRVTVGMNQQLINDTSKADKGFTAAVFEKQLLVEFRKRTSIDLSNSMGDRVPERAVPLLTRLLEESKKTIDSYQTVINVPGLKYKGLIPATFGTETATRFQAWSGVYLKQTAPDNLLRNAKNKADAYESATFGKLANMRTQQDEKEVFGELVEQGKIVRVMLPLFYGKECLACHGEPRGERDISGHAREGAKEGELGGAISVSIPVQ